MHITKRQGRRYRGGIATAKRPDAALAKDLRSLALGAAANARNTGFATAKRPDTVLAKGLWGFMLGAGIYAGKVVRVLP